MKLFLSTPRPEELSDEEWVENVMQLDWLAETGLLGVKKKDGNHTT